MNKLQVLILAVCAALASAIGDDSVFVVTDDNIEDTLKNNKYVLLEFYAPWCGHCKSLAPEYAKASDSMADYEPKVLIAKCDATENKKAAETYGVKGFPTLKWMVDGEASDYSGGRTEATIVSWIKKKTGPPAEDIASVEKLDAFKDSNDVAVLGVFASDAEKAAFEKAASGSEEVPYGISIGNAEVAKAAGVTAPAIVIFKKFDELRNDYTGDINSDTEIATFVSGNSLPLIVPFSQENAPKIFGGAIKVHCLVFVDSTASTSEALLTSIRPAAEANKGRALFVTVDKTDDRILEFFGIDGSKDLPTARVVEMGDAGMKKYSYEEDELNNDGLVKLMDAYFAGDLTPQLKSEDPPAEQGDVFVLVGKNFDEVVNKPGVDVLVEFYAPWCGHCKKLAPIYDELGAKYADNPNLIIAKMDATANEVESVQVSGFPTLKFWAADATEPIDYSGERDLDGFVAFLEKNAKSLGASK